MNTDHQKQPTPARSDNLLPADDAKDDGRYDVAEEVNLDEQSDAARRVGHAPELPATPAVKPSNPS